MPPRIAFEATTAACAPTENDNSWLSFAAPLSTTTISACCVPTPPGVNGKQRCERSDDDHEQRVAQCARDAEGLEEGRRRADAAHPAEQLRQRDRERVAARRAQDREALADAGGKCLAGDMQPPRCDDARDQDERRDDRGHGRIRDRPRPLERG